MGAAKSLNLPDGFRMLIKASSGLIHNSLGIFKFEAKANVNEIQMPMPLLDDDMNARRISAFLRRA